MWKWLCSVCIARKEKRSKNKSVYTEQNYPSAVGNLSRFSSVTMHVFILRYTWWCFSMPKSGVLTDWYPQWTRGHILNTVICNIWIILRVAPYFFSGGNIKVNDEVRVLIYPCGFSCLLSLLMAFKCFTWTPICSFLRQKNESVVSPYRCKYHLGLEGTLRPWYYTQFITGRWGTWRIFF